MLQFVLILARALWVSRQEAIFSPIKLIFFSWGGGRFTGCQDYFAHFELSQSLGGAKTRDPLEKTPDHPQAELGLSHMWPELGLNPQLWDDKRFRMLKISGLDHSTTRAAFQTDRLWFNVLLNTIKVESRCYWLLPNFSGMQKSCPTLTFCRVSALCKGTRQATYFTYLSSYNIKSTEKI